MAILACLKKSREKNVDGIVSEKVSERDVECRKNVPREGHRLPNLFVRDVVYAKTSARQEGLSTLSVENVFDIIAYYI